MFTFIMTIIAIVWATFVTTILGYLFIDTIVSNLDDKIERNLKIKKCGITLKPTKFSTTSGGSRFNYRIR